MARTLWRATRISWAVKRKTERESSIRFNRWAPYYKWEADHETSRSNSQTATVSPQDMTVTKRNNVGWQPQCFGWFSVERGNDAPGLYTLIPTKDKSTAATLHSILPVNLFASRLTFPSLLALSIMPSSSICHRRGLCGIVSWRKRRGKPNASAKKNRANKWRMKLF